MQIRDEQLCLDCVGWLGLLGWLAWLNGKIRVGSRAGIVRDSGITHFLITCTQEGGHPLLWYIVNVPGTFDGPDVTFTSLLRYMFCRAECLAESSLEEGDEIWAI